MDICSAGLAFWQGVSAIGHVSLNSSGDVHMEIVTKAKKSCTAYEKPSPRKAGRGRSPKKGVAVHLKELFVSHARQFQEMGTEL